MPASRVPRQPATPENDPATAPVAEVAETETDATRVDPPATERPDSTEPSPEAADDTAVLADDVPAEGGADEHVATDGATADGDDEAAAPGRRPLVIVLAVLAVVALIAGIVWFAITTMNNQRDEAIRETARTYLTAVADADADAALATLAERPANTSLLTAEVLAASREAAPLTDVTVADPTSDGNTASIGVHYRIGDRPVDTTLALSGDGRTSWKIADGTGELTVPERRALTINRATPADATNPVFPGTYTAQPTNQYVALAGTTVALVPAPDAPAAPLEVAPGLTDAGREAVLASVRTRFDECLAATDSRPANCPFGVSTEGVEVAPGSVRFSLANDPWAAFAPELDPQTLTARGTIPFTVNATATVTANGLTGQASVPPMQAERGFSVDLTAEPLVTTWW